MQKKSASIFMTSVFIISLSVFYLSPVLALSHGDRPTREERDAAREERAAEREAMLEERATEREAAKDERFAERCLRMAERVTARITRMEDNRDVHVGNYNRLLDRLDEIITRLNDEGLDTTDLQAVRDELTLMVEEYAAVFSALLAELQALEVDTCGDVEGGTRGFLGGAIDFLHELRELRQNIREFYRTDVRPAIKDLRDQAHDVAAEEEVEEGTESDE